jgi:3-phosphoshikimate 1-carboxyvinyltransferase
MGITMKIIEITPKTLSANIHIPPSKSYTHLAILCASLACGTSTVHNVMLSDDVIATIKAVESFGCDILYLQEDRPDFFTLKITGRFPLHIKNNTIDCRQSVSTLRYIIPLALTTNKQIVFTSTYSLLKKSFQDFYNMFFEKEIMFEDYNGNLPLMIQGLLHPGLYRVELPQTISSLLLILPLLKQDSTIRLSTPSNNTDNILITIDMLQKAGITIKCSQDLHEFFISGNQRYNAFDYTIEADYSFASLWLCASALGCNITSQGLDIKSKQPEKSFLKYISNTGAKIIRKGNGIKVKTEDILNGIKLNIETMPDILPIIAVLSSSIQGITQITGIRKLKQLQPERVKLTINMILSLGGDIIEISDGIIINGKGRLQGGTVNTAHDHRIAMASAIASVICEDNVTVTYADCVNKSYPLFWTDFRNAGGIFEEYFMHEY